MTNTKRKLRPLPPPWDRLFGLGSRIFVWGLLAGIIYLIRPFFLLLFLTFVFAYIQSHGVDGLAHRIGKRWVRVAVVFLVFLGTLVAIGVFLAPHIRDQVTTIADKHQVWIDDANKAIWNVADDKKWVPFQKGEVEGQGFDLRRTINQLIGLGDPKEGEEAVTKTIKFMQDVAGFLLAIGSAFFLALLFSFLIVLDLPRLTGGVQGLAQTKIGFIYNEVAGNIHDFCKVLGRAMEAQLFIAIINTVLTAVGMWIIGLGEGNMVFLCTIVFLCSFVPVAGVFISSSPICIVALSEHGFGMMMLAIVMITVVHLIEAYVLNPRVYGHHLRMNPVLTLIVLTVGGKLFGAWGLVLGIPVTNYVFSHAIRFRPPTASMDSVAA
ncbi:MAG: AI-2E family transporter [Planctomycetota bacterium]